MATQAECSIDAKGGGKIKSVG